MGGSSKFAYSNTNTSDTTTQLTNGTTYKAETFTYQFIVDTSQVEDKTGIRSLNGENITVDLTLVPNKDKNAPKVPEDNCHQLTITMQSAAIFNMEEPAVSVKTATFTCTYNASEGAASIWNDRNMALALTPAGNIPADLYLTVKIGNRNTVCKINRNKQFIIPFTAFGSNTVEVTICSNLFDIGASNYDYTFNAQWFVSASAAGSSPINGYKAGEEKTVKFEISKDTTPSLKINGTNHVYNKNSLLNSTLYVTVETKDIPDGATIKAALYRMDSEEDGSINYVKTTGDEDVSTIIGYSHELGAKSSQEAGNYCLRIKVTQNDNELLVVPYYFIILNEDGTITN
jgi:hypothetical protein